MNDPHVLSGPFWGELRVFLAVAKAKSFNRAAEELNMSQPTVSRHVKRLQDVIGSQLVIPTLSGIKLTEKGIALAESLLDLDHQLFALSHDLKGETREAEGLVRLSVTDGLAALFIAPNIAQLSEKHNKIHLHIRNPVNMTNLQDNQTDVMIGFLPTTALGVTCQKLGTIHFIPIAARSYIEQYGMPTRSNLETHVFIDSQYYSAKTGVWEPWQSTISRGVVAHYSDNSMAYTFMVKAGLGIGLLGTYTLSDPSAIPLDIDVHIAIPIFILALTERLASRPVRLVYDWLTPIFSPENPWFATELSFQSLPREEFWNSTAGRLAG
jgi:DNA-binding transcriptional LysR family regulator